MLRNILLAWIARAWEREIAAEADAMALW